MPPNRNSVSHVPTYDVVIVGAGPSGLAASYYLQSLNVLTLERESFVGGRVQTRRQLGTSYDLGAVFAYDRAWLPFDESHAMHEENGPIALLRGDELAVGSTVEVSLAQLALDPEERAEITAFRQGHVQAEELSGRTYEALNAHFKVIYPCEIKLYAPERQRDAFHRSNANHYVQGNGTMIEALVHRIQSPVLTNTEVSTVAISEDKVIVSYSSGGQQKQVRARTAIVATPATEAIRLIQTITDPCAAFLDCVEYGKFTVVAFGLEFQAELVNPPSYIVTSRLPFDTVVCQSTAEPRRYVLLVYYGESAPSDLHQNSDSDVLEQTLELLRTVPYDGIETAKVVFTDVQRWNPGGGILTQKHLAAADPQRIHASDLVILAGDYTYGPFPFGMNAALRAGGAAARAAMQNLLHIAVPPP